MQMANRINRFANLVLGQVHLRTQNVNVITKTDLSEESHPRGFHPKNTDFSVKIQGIPGWKFIRWSVLRTKKVSAKITHLEIKCGRALQFKFPMPNLISLHLPNCVNFDQELFPKLETLRILRMTGNTLEHPRLIRLSIARSKVLTISCPKLRVLKIEKAEEISFGPLIHCRTFEVFSGKLGCRLTIPEMPTIKTLRIHARINNFDCILNIKPCIIDIHNKLDYDPFRHMKKYKRDVILSLAMGVRDRVERLRHAKKWESIHTEMIYSPFHCGKFYLNEREANWK